MAAVGNVAIPICIHPLITAWPTEPGFVPGNPELIFEGRYFTSFIGRSYDIAPDGQRFLMLKAAATGELPSRDERSLTPCP